MVISVQVSVPIENPPYWYQVDAPVILDKTLSPQSKVIYAVISGLTRSTGECWASNEYISEMLGISKHTVSRGVSELKEAGHINSIVQDDYRRSIKLSYTRGSQKAQGGYTKMARGLAKNDEGVSQKAQDNSINELDKLIHTTVLENKYKAKDYILGNCGTITAINTYIRKAKIPEQLKREIGIQVGISVKHPYDIEEIHELVESMLPKDALKKETQYTELEKQLLRFEK